MILFHDVKDPEIKNRNYLGKTQLPLMVMTAVLWLLTQLKNIRNCAQIPNELKLFMKILGFLYI